MFRSPDWFVHFDQQIFSGGVYPPSPILPHAQSLFLFPIVFGVNLIHFFRWEGRCSRKFDRLFRCFYPLSRHLWEAKRRMGTVSKSATFWQRKVWTWRHSRGEKLRCKFWARKSANSSPILRCKFLARKSAKLIANFSATKVTSLPSLSLSLLSLSLSHQAHLTHNIGSASALPIIHAWYMYALYSLVQWNWFSDVTEACNSGASSDGREPISLHQAVGLPHNRHVQSTLTSRLVAAAGRPTSRPSLDTAEQTG